MSDYSRQIDAENERKIKEILNQLPQFAKLYFDDAKRSKLTRTRLAYAQDLLRFFSLSWITSPLKILKNIKLPWNIQIVPTSKEELCSAKIQAWPDICLHCVLFSPSMNLDICFLPVL